MLKFRRLLLDNDFTKALFDEINAHLAEQGVLMRPGTIVDATIIPAPSSTMNSGNTRDLLPGKVPTLLVAAAANESQRDASGPYEIAVSPPAVSDGFISVAAVARTDKGFKVAPFSNTGTSVSAPGVNILSAKAGGGLTRQTDRQAAKPAASAVRSHATKATTARGTCVA